MAHYEMLLSHKRRLIVEAHEQYRNAWEKFEENILNIIFTNTTCSELSFRIVTELFQLYDDSYTCSYICDHNVQHTIHIHTDLVSSRVERCKNVEQIHYAQLMCLPQHVISLLFFYSLGLQK